MSLVPTCLVEQNIFFREGLKSLLAETNYHVRDTCRDCVELQNESTAKDDVKLFIIGVESDADTIRAQISIIKDMFPESRAAVLTALAEPACVLSAFSSGADGYLLRDIAPQALTGSLDMIMAGEKVFPAAALNMFAKQATGSEVKNIDNPFGAYRLSIREVQVLKYLSIGETNKEIARDLDITEATVKVHIKAVLRKLDLSNRTQAAVWAVNKGLVGQDKESVNASAA